MTSDFNKAKKSSISLQAVLKKIH